MTSSIERFNPADTRELVSSYEVASPKDVAAACDRAAASAEGWTRTPGPKRAECLYRAASLLDQRAEATATAITLEEGKLLSDALGETKRAAAVLRFHAGEAERASGEAGDSGDPGTIAFTRRRPLGVVGVITPWNFPIAIPAWKTAPAIAAGNAVVLKPASRAPGGALAFAQALADAGLPEGVLETVIADPESANVLVEDDRIRALTFTGSNAVGEMLRARITARGARFQGELGGNNPLIVLADADLDHAVATATGGAFGAAGQKCTATRRVIVVESIYDEFVERLSAAADALVVGSGLNADVDVPPLVDLQAQTEVSEAIKHAVSHGATVTTSRSDFEIERGCYVAPTVVVGAQAGTPLIDDEVFGPVCAVLSAVDTSEAIEIANSTPFGLSAAICTNDLVGVMDFIQRIDAGMVHVNRPTPGADPHLPFGGVKGSSASGYREQGRAAVEFFTEGQTVYIQAPPSSR